MTPNDTKAAPTAEALRATAPTTPPTQTSAVVAATPQQGVEVAQDLTLQNVAGRDGVERFETIITIPVEYQYAIPIRGVKDARGNWRDDLRKVGLLSDAYDYMNRVIGATFFLPAQVHDQDDVMRHNPIHRKDYIYMRVGAVWYNPMGQMVLAIEDVEVDFQLVWMDARVNAKSAKPIMENGQLTFDNFGNPALKLSEDDEMKALKELTRLRGFGPRYAFTVARTRLMKLASGIRSVPNSSEPVPFRVRIVGYRDKMTPQERIAAVTSDTTALFGSAPDFKPLTSDEMTEVSESNVASEAELDEAAVAGGAPIGTSPDTDAPPAPAAHVEPEPVTRMTTAESEAAAAQASLFTAPDTCGSEHPDVNDVCVVVVDAEGKHTGGHANKDMSLIWPQTA